MAHAAEFNASAAMLIKARGVSVSYRRKGIKKTLNAYIKHDLEIFEENSDIGMTVTAAYVSKGEFQTEYPGKIPKNGDRITVDGTDWDVLKRLKDNGVYYVLEIAQA